MLKQLTVVRNDMDLTVEDVIKLTMQGMLLYLKALVEPGIKKVKYKNHYRCDLQLNCELYDEWLNNHDNLVNISLNPKELWGLINAALDMGLKEGSDYFVLPEFNVVWFSPLEEKKVSTLLEKANLQFKNEGFSRDTKFLLGRYKIDINPRVNGGEPCLTGTRITVSNLIAYLQTGATLEEFCSVHQVPQDIAESALEWARFKLGDRNLED